MISLLQKYSDNNAIVILAIIVLFLVIVGAALYLTPRIAAWLDQREKTHPGYYDGMLQEDPNQKKADEKGESEGDSE